MMQGAPLEDSFGRRIDYLRVSVTDRCNLKCVYCVPKTGVTHIRESGILSSEEIARFVSIVIGFGLRKVRLTGGEPLLRPDIVRLVSLIKATGIRDLSLTTNGIHLADTAEDLKKAGINRVNVSLDTLDPEKYRTITRGGDIYRVLEGIKKAEEAGLYPVKIRKRPDCIRSRSTWYRCRVLLTTKSGNSHRLPLRRTTTSGTSSSCAWGEMRRSVKPGTCRSGRSWTGFRNSDDLYPSHSGAAVLPGITASKVPGVLSGSSALSLTIFADPVTRNWINCFNVLWP
jgi:hypothetical protein